MKVYLKDIEAFAVKEQLDALKKAGWSTKPLKKIKKKDSNEEEKKVIKKPIAK